VFIPLFETFSFEINKSRKIYSYLFTLFSKKPLNNFRIIFTSLVLKYLEIQTFFSSFFQVFTPKFMSNQAFFLYIYLSNMEFSLAEICGNF